NNMLHRFSDSPGIIDLDITDQRFYLAHIQKHNGQTAKRKLIQKMAVDFRRHDGNAIDLALDHSAHTPTHTLGVVIRIGNNHFVATMDSGKLKTLHQLREKRVDDVRDDQAEHLAAS